VTAATEELAARGEAAAGRQAEMSLRVGVIVGPLAQVNAGGIPVMPVWQGSRVALEGGLSLASVVSLASALDPTATG
jgi:hypothetical protein